MFLVMNSGNLIFTIVNISIAETIFRISMAVNIRVKVHPVVLFQITDSFERRNLDSPR